MSEHPSSVEHGPLDEALSKTLPPKPTASRALPSALEPALATRFYADPRLRKSSSTSPSVASEESGIRTAAQRGCIFPASAKAIAPAL